MQKLVNYINTLGDSAHTGPKLNSADIILCQKELMLNGIAAIPKDYLEFLHHFNALTCGGSALFGILPLGDFYLDLLRENILLASPQKENLIILGYDEMSLLGYNQKNSCYQIIDKTDMEVLNTYNSCTDALSYILKIDNV